MEFLVTGAYRWIAIIGFIGVLIGGLFLFLTVGKTLSDPDFQAKIMRQNAVKTCVQKAHRELGMGPSKAQLTPCLTEQGIDPQKVEIVGDDNRPGEPKYFVVKLDGKPLRVIVGMADR